MRVRCIAVSGSLVLALASMTGATQVVSESASPCLNLRSAPAEAAIGCLAPGERVDVLERDGDWGRVRATDGSEGWLALAYTTPASRVDAAVPVREAMATVQVLLGGGGTLYDQTDSPAGVGFASQLFDAANSGFDCRAADDFTVPAVDIQWDIGSVKVLGTFLNGTGPTPALNVEFFSDAGGVPGGSACSYTGLQLGVDFNGTGGSFSINLPTVCNLPAGTYWVSVQADMDSTTGGQWLWAERAVPAGAEFAWENPPDGFGTGCVTWSPSGGCGASESDLLFSLGGVIVPVELQTFAVE